MPDAKRLHDAKQKKEQYHQESIEEVQSQEAQPEKRELSDWTDIVGQRIEQAMREGSFDNLPGQGKPLNLNKNPFVPEDRQMAYKLLENNDLAPSWIAERSDLLTAIETFRQQVHAGVHAQQAALHGTTEPASVEELAKRWGAHLANWAVEIRTLNKRIDSVNLQQPIAHLEIIKLRLTDELNQAGAGTDLLPPS